MPLRRRARPSDPVPPSDSSTEGGISPATGCDPDTERPSEPGSASDTARCPERGRPWAIRNACGRLIDAAEAHSGPLRQGSGVATQRSGTCSARLISPAHLAVALCWPAAALRCWLGTVTPSGAGFNAGFSPGNRASASVRRAHCKTGGHGAPKTWRRRPGRAAVVPYVDVPQARRGRGETGRRARFRSWSREGWRFESSRPHRPAGHSDGGRLGHVGGPLDDLVDEAVVLGPRRR